MLDCTRIDPTDTAGWHARLCVGDTVSYRFPVAEDQGGPRPKPRPCLVLDVRRIDGVDHALLAYGTSARTKANRGDEVEVRGVDARAAAGLDKRTRFVCARKVLVPLTDPAIRKTPTATAFGAGTFRRSTASAQTTATARFPGLSSRSGRPASSRSWRCGTEAGRCIGAFGMSSIRVSSPTRVSDISTFEP